MEEEIRALLLADSGVSGHVDNRINFGAHPQGAPLPAIVLNTISDVQDYNINSPSGISQARLQVDCYATTYGAAKRLSRTVLRLLSGYSGGVVQGAFHAGSRDSREGGTNSVDRPFRTSIDFTLTYDNEENF